MHSSYVFVLFKIDLLIDLFIDLLIINIDPFLTAQ